MTLLESLVALVIVGLFAVGILEALQVSGASARTSGDWATAVAYADATMEARVAPTGSEPGPLPPPPGFGAALTSRDWSEGVAEFVVTVTMPNGSRFLLRRLARK